MPKVRGMKTCLNALERSSKKVVDSLAHQGGRYEGIDGSLRCVEEFIKDILGEFQGLDELI